MISPQTRFAPKLQALFSATSVMTLKLMIAATMLALTGCALPRSGPLLSEMESAGRGNTIVLSEVTAAVAEETRVPSQDRFPASFVNTPAFEYDKLGPGDRIAITVWERDGLNVFPPSSDGGGAKLGEMALDSAGDIQVPYTGTVHAQGLTTAQLRDVMIRRLSRLMATFDVTVVTSARQGRTVSVQGDLLKPGVYPIDRGTTRLSELLGISAPNQANPEQLKVTVRRQGTSASVRLADIYRDNSDDIALLPGDSVILTNVTERLYVLGATGTQGSVKIARRNFSLLDALGESRALSDTAANPRGVFLMRSPATAANSATEAKPTVYRFDFTRPEHIALAGKFVIRDGDAVLVSDAPFAQIQKVLSTFSATLGIARSAAAIGN